MFAHDLRFLFPRCKSICTSVRVLQRGTAIPTRLNVRPPKTQTRLRIRAAWSESSLSACRRFGSLATHIVPCEDSDQNARMLSCRKCCVPAQMPYLELWLRRTMYISSSRFFLFFFFCFFFCLFFVSLSFFNQMMIKLLSYHCIIYYVMFVFACL